jgi:hypothetical protein
MKKTTFRREHYLQIKSEKNLFSRKFLLLVISPRKKKKRLTRYYGARESSISKQYLKTIEYNIRIKHQ